MTDIITIREGCVEYISETDIPNLSTGGEIITGYSATLVLNINEKVNKLTITGINISGTTADCISGIFIIIPGTIRI